MSEPPQVNVDALALIDYPEQFPLKVFGRQGEDFEDIVLQLVRARCPQSESIELSKRESSGGKYISLTVTFTAYSQKQIEEIYQDLYDCSAVVMTL